MLYYKVIVPDKMYRNDPWLETIKDELFTPAEFKKFSTPDKYGCKLSPKWVMPIYHSRKRTYWFFGARYGY